jgi:hypothetical protein
MMAVAWPIPDELPVTSTTSPFICRSIAHLIVCVPLSSRPSASTARPQDCKHPLPERSDV